MAEVNEQTVSTGNITSVKKPIIIVTGVIICLIIAYFAFTRTSTIKPPADKQQIARLTPTLAPLAISEKPQTEMMMDIKNQLIKAFK